MNKRTAYRMATGGICLLLLIAVWFTRGETQEPPPLQVVEVGDGLYMLVGRGGNIGVFAGEDGVFMIDDQFAPVSEKIRQAVAGITDRPIRFLINTHFHGDHTGGNANFGKAGAVIVAHENVRKRLSTEQFIAFFQSKMPPSPKEALPIITFQQSLSFHLNGDDIRVYHPGFGAHTDGDAIIFFPKTNAVHTGDVYFNGTYPFIDVPNGGSVNGVIRAVEYILSQIQDDTKLIPGHGPLSTGAELKAYHRMLVGVRDKVAGLIRQGKSKEEILAAHPTAEFDAQWGKGFIKPDAFAEIVYSDLSRKQ